MSGKLIMNALVMYDRQTDSLWSQFLGESVEGPLKGSRLEIVPAQLLPYGAWIVEHPDSQVLDTSGPRYDHYTTYYYDESAGIFGEANEDERLRTKALVLGVTADRGQKAYDLRDLIASPVVNDAIAGDELVVVVDPATLRTGVFDRKLGERTLTFEGEGDGIHMTDLETGSTWRKFTGAASKGELAGAQLLSVPFFVSFWFAWTDYYPETELYASESPP